MTIDGQFENGDPKTVTDIIREIYDVVNPYKDDVTVAEAAFNKKNGKVGTGIGKGDAAGSVAFKTIEPVDFNSDVTIEGVAQSPLGYLEDQLDETLDEGSNATGPEIEKALTQAINSVLPQVALDNIKVRISATDADSGEPNKGQIYMIFEDPNGNITSELITNTNNMSTAQLWIKTQKLLEKTIETYNKNEKPL